MGKRPNLTLTLSKDKNTLSASGHWSNKRVNRVIEDSDNEARTVLYENFEGVNGKFILGELTNKSIIVAKMTNTTTDQLAKITFTFGNGNQEIFELNPGETITTKYDVKKIIINVEYKANQKTNNQIELMNTIKKIIRKGVTNENGVLKSLDFTEAVE